MRETLRKIVMAVLMTPAAATVLPLAAQAQGHDQTPFEKLAGRRAAVVRVASARAGGEISEENYKQFDLGFALVRAGYFSQVAVDDEEFNSDAIVELVYLADRLEGQPEAAKLEAVLKMVVRGTGTAEQRWDAVGEVVKSYSARQQPGARWFFDSGVTLTKVSLYSYLEDQPNLQAELKTLQQLIAKTPQGVPAEVTKPMREVAQYAAQQALTSDDYEKIAETAGQAMESVLS
jgi:hypothetical protein